MSVLPHVVALVGVSGAGKDALLARLLEEHQDKFVKPVSHTTRQARANETHGVDYHFVTVEEFARMKDDGHFIETIRTHGNWYGLGKKAMEAPPSGVRHALIVNHHGLVQLRQHGWLVRAVLIGDPGDAEVRRRLEARGDAPDAIATRLRTAEEERAAFAQHADDFDAHVANTTTLDAAWQQLREALQLV